jgi:UDP-N-acetyl-2-amino-2-deoxyglucuronate dehydrogenase
VTAPPDSRKNFALIAAAGYIAPRHMQAIRETGHELVAAVDPRDSVGVLDRWFPEARFFTEIERFDRHVEKLRRLPEPERIHYVSICSPNHLHDAHVRLALRAHAHAICEKPLVVNPWNLDQLLLLEEEFGRHVYTVMQLRHHPALVELKARLAAAPSRERHDVELTYVTPRGPWYQVSWKGNPEKSGGLAMNIGVHFFDLLLWLFGPAERCDVHLAEATRTAGSLELERARVRWYLSIDAADAPAKPGPTKPHRTLSVDGREVAFSDGMEGLHTRVYEEVLAGRGLRIADARPSIELLYRIRTTAVTPPRAGLAHAFLDRARGR